MSYAQKIKGKVLELVERETKPGDNITAGDMFELAIFFTGMGKVFGSSAKKMSESFDQAIEEQIIGEGEMRS